MRKIKKESHESSTTSKQPTNMKIVNISENVDGVN